MLSKCIFCISHFVLHNCCMFWICFEFYALLFGFVSYFVPRVSYFLFRACLVLAMPA
ncbi:hypothetical protein KsCSTR_21790 [Candidatus Kuenenia stuttgartiensis]|uniref:Uncharacterized protein n=1 Tax=Kuenenia stuttgartiensis TaxID=174633 RepID=Q1Q358_KUEST|nr:hypothetical protein KsCSTR_21790 [Candidatus Kuenenia stuttgartiensis]CAJ74452.1 unknown protein [Candidatus Kuenenia stuttgartiensis]